MYVADWDREDYFSVLNVRKRKFEKERLERQLQAEAERVKKQEMEARQAELARAEAERLKMELMAAALRYECDAKQPKFLSTECFFENHGQCLKFRGGCINMYESNVYFNDYHS